MILVDKSTNVPDLLVAAKYSHVWVRTATILALTILLARKYADR